MWYITLLTYLTWAPYWSWSFNKLRVEKAHRIVWIKWYLVLFSPSSQRGDHSENFRYNDLNFARPASQDIESTWPPERNAGEGGCRDVDLGELSKY